MLCLETCSTLILLRPSPLLSSSGSDRGALDYLAEIPHRKIEGEVDTRQQLSGEQVPSQQTDSENQSPCRVLALQSSVCVTSRQLPISGSQEGKCRNQRDEDQNEANVRPE